MKPDTRFAKMDWEFILSFVAMAAFFAAFVVCCGAFERWRLRRARSAWFSSRAGNAEPDASLASLASDPDAAEIVASIAENADLPAYMLRATWKGQVGGRSRSCESALPKLPKWQFGLLSRADFLTLVVRFT